MKRTIQSEPQECLTLRVEDAAVILGISLSSAYSLTEKAYKNKHLFHVIKIGKSYRILKESFYAYIYGTNEKGA